MKTKIITLILAALMSCAAIASDKEVRVAEQKLGRVQQEMAQLASKKKTMEAKIQKAEHELQEATEKMEANQDKPKSLLYKNAVKKAETAQQKAEELRTSVQAIVSEMEAKNDEIKSLQQELTAALLEQDDAAQAKEDTKAAKLQAKEDAKLAKQREKDSIKLAKQKANDEKSAQKNQEISAIEPANQAAKSHRQESPFQETKHATSKDGKLPQWLFWAGLIFIGLCLWIEFRKKHHCPKCGRWFTMKHIRGNYTRDENQKKIYKSVRRCSSCGYQREYFSEKK